jgi:cytochrome c-type biogenesis protein CcmH/NrfG
MKSLRTIPTVVFLGLIVLPASAANSPRDLLAAGRVDEAITALQGQISARPNNAESYNLLCRAYFSVGDWDRAVSYCDKAVRLEPSNSQYHLWLGRAFGEKASHSSFWTAAGLAKKLRSELERSVALDPSNIDARTDLAEFYLEAPGIVGGGQDKARAASATLATMNPAKAHWVNARIAEKNKDATAAEKEYRLELETSHGSADAWLDMALFYRRNGRLEKMEDAINRAARVEIGRPDVLVDASETLIRAGRNFPFAIQLLHRYLSSSMVEEAPAFKAHYLLGTILEKQGDKQSAAQEYKASLALARNFGRAQEALNRLGQ